MRVLAAPDNVQGARAVARFAAALAPVLVAEVDALHVRTDGAGEARAAAAAAGIPLRMQAGEPRARLHRDAEAEDVAAVVLGRSGGRAAGPVGAIAAELLLTLSKPVAVVPADAPHPARLARILVPLEGTRSTSLAPRRTIELARDADIEIVLLHVFGPDSLPSFTDQPQHEAPSWTAEFLARYSPCPPEDVRLEIRVGRPDELVVTVAREIDADVIALGWSRTLAEGRAAVVRATLEQAHLPIFLIPVVSEDRPGAAAPALTG